MTKYKYCLDFTLCLSLRDFWNNTQQITEKYNLYKLIKGFNYVFFVKNYVPLNYLLSDSITAVFQAVLEA